MQRQRRPREVDRHAPPHGLRLRPLLLLRLRLRRPRRVAALLPGRRPPGDDLGQQLPELQRRVHAQPPRADDVGAPLLARGPPQHAPAGQVRAVLEVLEGGAGEQLGPGDEGREPAGAGAAPGRGRGRRGGEELEGQPLRPEVHAQQPPQAGDGAGLAGEVAEVPEAGGEEGGEAGGGGGGGGDGPGGLPAALGGGREQDGRLGRQGEDEGDELAGGRAGAAGAAGAAEEEGGARQGGEEGAGQARGVADEEEDGVDARGRGEAALQVGEEGVGGLGEGAEESGEVVGGGFRGGRI